MAEQTAIELPESMLTEVPTVDSVRRQLVKISGEMYDQSKPYMRAMVEGGDTPSRTHAMRAAIEGLCTGNVFAFALAAVLRVAQDSDHPAAPILAERMTRIAAEALNSGLDWIGDANDDLAEVDGGSAVSA